ncbi:MAG: STAS domain-containing protein [Candidatus Aquicultor sp.]
MKAPENFSCQIIALDSELLVSLQGDLDMYTTSILQEDIWDHLYSSIKIITIDCDRVRFVDSAFLQLLTIINMEVESVRIINASRTIRKIFEITGLDDIFIQDKY